MPTSAAGRAEIVAARPQLRRRQVMSCRTVVRAAVGFLLKDAEPRELIAAVRAASQGDALISPHMTRRLVAEFATRTKQPRPTNELDGLTVREREVLALVAEGLDNAEIASRLCLSPATARTHVSRILTKLDARNRAGLVVLAYETGLVRPGWTA
jgi:DNA-binding NarL/FixJ family response regulator